MVDVSDGSPVCRWMVLTFKLTWYCLFHDSISGLYDEVKLVLNIFQTAALLEVFGYLLSPLLI